MTAKEYYTKYLDSVIDCADPTVVSPKLSEVLWAFVLELKETNANRHIITMPALLSVIKELDKKWKALIRLVEVKNMTMSLVLANISFLSYVVAKFPDLRAEFPGVTPLNLDEHK